MGVKFEVKPTPIRFDKIVETRREMLQEWMKENHPDTYNKVMNDDISFDEYNLGDLEAINAWRLDVEFRSKYCKYTAENCMNLDKKLDDNVWESDDLELGTLEEAWDFFTNRRQVPLTGV
jgi:hypothetical protein